MEQQESLKLVNDGYKIESLGLAFIAQSEAFSAIVSALANYRNHILERQRTGNSQELIHSLSAGSGVISSSTDSHVLREIFYFAHTACCCELFDGWSIPLAVLGSNLFYEFVHDKINADITGDPLGANRYQGKLHAADAIRAIQILRLLGVLTFDSTHCRQLSLGAGYGRKDIDSIHKIPRISGASDLLFSTINVRPGHVVLVDNDEGLEEIYKKMNSDSEGVVRAFNCDALEALDIMPGLIKEGSIDYRNFIMGIRVDHRMIDDTETFFRKIALIMEPQADFVISVGSGYSIEEYQGRLELMSSIFSWLCSRHLDPLHLVLHRGDTPQQNRHQPSFGHPATATHEILYCKLDRDMLA